MLPKLCLCTKARLDGNHCLVEHRRMLPRPATQGCRQGGPNNLKSTRVVRDPYNGEI